MVFYHDSRNLTEREIGTKLRSDKRDPVLGAVVELWATKALTCLEPSGLFVGIWKVRALTAMGKMELQGVTESPSEMLSSCSCDIWL